MDAIVDVKELPTAVRRELEMAFGATGCMDLYQGNAVQMLQVIRQSLEDRQDKIDALKKLAKKMTEVVAA